MTEQGDPDDAENGEEIEDTGADGGNGGGADGNGGANDGVSDAGGSGASESGGAGGSSNAGGGRATLGADEQYCSSCGEPIKKEAEICPHCGVRNASASGGGGSNKDRTTAGVLAILLGGIGAHKFYLNESGMGILYLCFSWTLIPAIIGFIEGIIYLTKSDEEFQRQYVD